MDKVTVKKKLEYLLVLGCFHHLKTYSKPNFFTLRSKDPLKGEYICVCPESARSHLHTCTRVVDDGRRL